MMKVLYVNSDRIKKQDIIWGFLEAGVDVDIYDVTVHMDSVIETEVEALKKIVTEYDFALSQNFIPAVALACHDRDVRYASWIYDCPQYHLFSEEALYDTNFVFAFDKKQAEELKKSGILHSFYLPLAGNVSKASLISIAADDEKRFSCDVSFVGNLYRKNTYSELYQNAPVSIRNDMERQLSENFFCWENGKSIYGGLQKETSDVLIGLMNTDGNWASKYDVLHAAETLTLVYELACRERSAILSKSAQFFNTFLYTTKPLECNIDKLMVKGPVYDDDMYKAFYFSKINLNITMRSIESGIPQRVFDIMAVGGCVFTNYQEEVGELFDIDKDIVVYHCMEEYLDKARYYLANDDKRIRVGVNGYTRVRDEYNYKNASLKILRMIAEN